MNCHIKKICCAVFFVILSLVLLALYLTFYVDKFHALVFTNEGCYSIDYVPYTIRRSGKYCLQKNLTSHKTAIKIKANDVSLNLNFNTLSGPGDDPSTDSIGVKSKNYKNITVYNGTIQGFKMGVFIYGDDLKNIDSKANYGHRVQNVIFKDNFFRGIRLDGRDSLIIGNTVLNTGGSTTIPNSFAIGIETYGARNLISFNVVTDTYPTDAGEGVGISLSGFASGTIVSYNIIKNSRQKSKNYGIWVGANIIVPTRVALIGNIVEGFEYGLLASSPVQHIFLQDNQLSKNHTSFLTTGGSARLVCEQEAC